MRAEIVATGVPLGEGPVWCPDGSLVITRLGPGMLQRIDVASGEVRTVATMDGGANAAQLASDGGFIVTNNGGLDFTPFAARLGIDPAAVVYQPGPPGLQRVGPDGAVTYLHDQGFQAPNDLVVAPDGTVYFTDPPPAGAQPTATPVGRVWERRPDGALRVVAGGFSYCNGIARSPEGRLLIVEAGGLAWIDVTSGETEWFVEEFPGGAVGDGFAFDTDGRVYVCSPMGGGVHVVDQDGQVVATIPLGDGAIPTNCCFGGADGTTLFTTELAPGRVMAIEGVPAPGLDLVPWPVPGQPT